MNPSTTALARNSNEAIFISVEVSNENDGTGDEVLSWPFCIFVAFGFMIFV
jgi:hypothetical protein